MLLILLSIPFKIQWALIGEGLLLEEGAYLNNYGMLPGHAECYVTHYMAGWWGVGGEIGIGYIPEFPNPVLFRA